MGKNSKAADFNAITEGIIWKQILIFFFPILFGTFFQQLYNTADAMIVGKFVGKEALSAVGGTTMTLTNLLVGFFVGVSSGAAVVISQYYGARDSENVRKAVHTSFCMVLICSVIFTIGGVALAPAAIHAMQVPPEIVDYSVTYLRVYFLGITGNLVYNMGAAVLRAVGDSKHPLYFLVASCITNIVLDIVFVVGFNMEVLGVAIGTIISQLVSAILTMYVLINSDGEYRFRFKELKIDKDIMKQVIKIGLPAGCQSVMYSVSNIIIQAKINTFGTNTIAAWTVYGKIDGLFWMVMDAMSIAITTFAGQNYGAGKYHRLKKGNTTGLFLSLIITIVLGGGMMLLGTPLCMLFTNDAAVLEEGLWMLHFLIPFWFCYICVNVYPSTLRGTGDAFIPMLIICFGTCVFRVIWIFTAGAFVPTLKSTLLSYPISWSITSVAFLIYYYKFSKMKKLNHIEE